jgi:hypothetical protein
MDQEDPNVESQPARITPDCTVVLRENTEGFALDQVHKTWMSDLYGEGPWRVYLTDQEWPIESMPAPQGKEWGWLVILEPSVYVVVNHVQMVHESNVVAIAP